MPTKPTARNWDEFALAIHRINPTSEYRKINDTEYEWRGPGGVPTEAQINTAWAQAKTDLDNSTANNQRIDTELAKLKTILGNGPTFTQTTTQTQSVVPALVDETLAGTAILTAVITRVNQQAVAINENRKLLNQIIDILQSAGLAK